MSIAKCQTVAETSLQNQVNSSTTPFPKELLEHLYKPFQSSRFSNPSCSLAQAGNYRPVALSNVKINSVFLNIIDYGATDHMAGRASQFFPSSPCVGNKFVFLE